ncbi:MAG: hypothetical protein ACK4HV_06335, partial [Parachlamydiaceae bacterium]
MRNFLNIIGVALIASGAFIIGYQSFSYTTNQTEINIGGLELQVKEKEVVPLSPILGGIAIIAGVAILLI